MRYVIIVIALLFMAVPVHAESLALSGGVDQSASNASIVLTGDNFSLGGGDPGALGFYFATPGSSLPFNGAIGAYVTGNWLGTLSEPPCASFIGKCGYASAQYNGVLTMPDSQQASLTFVVPATVHLGFSPTLDLSYDMTLIGTATVHVMGFALNPTVFNYVVDHASVSFSTVPEPSTWLLLANGLLGLAVRLRPLRCLMSRRLSRSSPRLNEALPLRCGPVLLALLFLAAPVSAETLTVTAGLLGIPSNTLSDSSLSIEGDGFSLGGSNDTVTINGLGGAPGAVVPFDKGFGTLAAGTLLGHAYGGSCFLGLPFSCPFVSLQFSGTLVVPTEEVALIIVTAPVQLTGTIVNPASDLSNVPATFVASGIATFELHGSALFGGPFVYTGGFHTVSFARAVPEPRTMAAAGDPASCCSLYRA